MPAKLPERVKEGETLSASWLNALRDLVAELAQRGQIRVDGVGLEASQSAFGTILRGGFGVGEIRLGKSPGTAISSGSTGTVTLYTYGSTSSLSADTITATNPWPESCPAGRKVAIGTINGVPNCILWWSCNLA